MHQVTRTVWKVYSILCLILQFYMVFLFFVVFEFCFKFIFSFFLIGVWLLYNTVLVSAATVFLRPHSPSMGHYSSLGHQISTRKLGAGFHTFSFHFKFSEAGKDLFNVFFVPQFLFRVPSCQNKALPSQSGEARTHSPHIPPARVPVCTRQLMF